MQHCCTQCILNPHTFLSVFNWTSSTGTESGALWITLIQCYLKTPSCARRPLWTVLSEPSKCLFPTTLALQKLLSHIVTGCLRQPQSSGSSTWIRYVYSCLFHSPIWSLAASANPDIQEPNVQEDAGHRILSKPWHHATISQKNLCAYHLHVQATNVLAQGSS